MLDGRTSTGYPVRPQHAPHPTPHIGHSLTITAKFITRDILEVRNFPVQIESSTLCEIMYLHASPAVRACMEPCIAQVAQHGGGQGRGDAATVLLQLQQYCPDSADLGGDMYVAGLPSAALPPPRSWSTPTP